MSKLQEDFINVLVKGLCNSYMSAKLLPGEMIEIADAETTTTAAGHSESSKVFHSQLTSNLKSNYEMWCEITKKEEQAAANGVTT